MDLGKLNNMYQFSAASFMRLFEKALCGPKEDEPSDLKTKGYQKRLQHIVYQYVSRSVFKADRLSFALHLVNKMHSQQIPEDEWNVFTGQAVSDVKIESSKVNENLPSWIDEERAFDVFVLKSGLPNLYTELMLEDKASWSSFARSGECENNFPVQLARKLTPFQQVLVIQALRPDRLYSALVQFALQTLGLHDLSPPALSLKQLLPETLSMEPVLLVISPGADPSEELRALAQLTVGDQHYFEVAMGQGQKTVALDHLCAAARQGDWLCLKNLHLMTCTRKEDIHSTRLAKFYEFSDADIRAGSEILQELFQKDSSSVKWDFVHGLYENAIYGGRVDNIYDIRVLSTYLKEFFSTSVIVEGKTPLGPGISIPATSNYQAHINAIQQLSDTDKPAYFGLPANVQRSWQRITSREVINKLKALMRSTEKFKKFNREEWQALLTPLLNLWKKLNQ
ncbi:hypothetical protein L9F63_019419, partial [Diploptera punctata]